MKATQFQTAAATQYKSFNIATAKAGDAVDNIIQKAIACGVPKKELLALTKPAICPEWPANDKGQLVAHTDKALKAAHPEAALFIGRVNSRFCYGYKTDKAGLIVAKTAAELKTASIKKANRKPQTPAGKGTDADDKNTQKRAAMPLQQAFEMVDELIKQECGKHEANTWDAIRKAVQTTVTANESDPERQA